MEYVLYYIHITRLEFLGNVFFMQLKVIDNRYQESYITICQLFKNLIFCPLYLMLYKNQQFIIYIEKYDYTKIIKEMDKLILSPYFRKRVTNISPNSFKLFSFIEIYHNYQKYALLT